MVFDVCEDDIIDASIDMLEHICRRGSGTVVETIVSLFPEKEDRRLDCNAL